MNPIQNLWLGRLSMKSAKYENLVPICHNQLNKDHTFEDKWKICQTPDGKITKIVNCSNSNLKVDDILLKKNQEHFLVCGETVSFGDSFDYVFVPMKIEPKNELKRERDENNFLQNLEKQVKVDDNVREERNFIMFGDPMFNKENQTSESSSNEDAPQKVWKSGNKRGEKKPPKRRIFGEEICSQNIQQQKINFPNGDAYEGETKNGSLMHGKGTLTFKNGDKYEGKWNNNVIQPEVTIHYADGKKFVGKIDQDNFHMKQGKGTLTFKEGIIFEAYWIDDVMQPQVAIDFGQGGRYEGEVNPDTFRRQGKGLLWMRNGDFYDGYFVNEFFEGQGIYTWKDGDVYEGEWKERKRDGWGIMKYTSGVTFEGLWKKDKREGKGKIIEKNGDSVEGKWVKDLLQNRVKISYANGDKYEGEIRRQDFNRHGKGIFIYKNGDVYDGYWKNDKKEGKGILRCENGLRYEGQWKEDQRSGEGKWTYPHK